MPGLQMTKSRNRKALAQSFIPWLQIPRCHYLFIEVMNRRDSCCVYLVCPTPENSWLARRDVQKTNSVAVCQYLLPVINVLLLMSRESHWYSISVVLHLCAAGYVNITMAVLLKLPVLVFCLTVLVVDYLFYFIFLRKSLRYVCAFADSHFW